MVLSPLALQKRLRAVQYDDTMSVFGGSLLELHYFYVPKLATIKRLNLFLCRKRFFRPFAGQLFLPGSSCSENAWSFGYLDDADLHACDGRTHARARQRTSSAGKGRRRALRPLTARNPTTMLARSGRGSATRRQPLSSRVQRRKTVAACVAGPGRRWARQ